MHSDTEDGKKEKNLFNFLSVRLSPRKKVVPKEFYVHELLAGFRHEPIPKCK